MDMSLTPEVVTIEEHTNWIAFGAGQAINDKDSFMVETNRSADLEGASGGNIHEFVAALGNWRNGRGPLWSRLADAVDTAIERGELSLGDRLPSERHMAENLSIGRSTIVRALSALAERGAVSREHGSGTFVSASTRPTPPRPGGPWPLSEYYRTTDRVPVGLGAAVVPSTEGLPEELLRLDLTDFIGEEGTQSGYTLPGLPSTREAVASMLRNSGVAATADSIVITTGATQATSLILGLLVRPGDVVIVDRRAYPGTLALLRRAGVRVVPAPETSAGHTDTDVIHRYALQHAATAVVVQTTCNAATGESIPEQARLPLVDLATRGVAILDDRTLSDFHPLPAPKPLAAMSQHRNIFTVGSLNKIYWGGLRLGWAHVRESLVPTLMRAKSASDSGTSVPSQLIANRMLAHHDQVAQTRRDAVAASRTAAVNQLEQLLPDWRIESPPVGPALWVRLPLRDASTFVEYAFTRGDVISYGGDFRADGRPSQHVRLSLTNNPATTAELVGRLATAWDQYRGLMQRRVTA